MSEWMAPVIAGVGALTAWALLARQWWESRQFRRELRQREESRRPLLLHQRAETDTDAAVAAVVGR